MSLAYAAGMHAAARARKEQEATAQAIEARAAASAVLNDSNDDTAPPNGLDQFLDEI